jgi:hypothetical protein
MWGICDVWIFFDCCCVIRWLAMGQVTAGVAAVERTTALLNWREVLPSLGPATGFIQVGEDDAMRCGWLARQSPAGKKGRVDVGEREMPCRQATGHTQCTRQKPAWAG